MPFPLLAAAPAALQTGLGIVQGITGMIRAHKAEKSLEKLTNNSPQYTGSQSIKDYYKQALNRYQTSPYQSQQYQQTQNAANRSLASGLNSLQGRHGAISGVSRLTAINNDTMAKAGVSAENEQNQRFSQLGGATGMKSGDEKYGFQINKLMPYENKRALYAQKAAGGAQIMNAGLSNIFGGVSSGSQIASDYYGNQQQQQQQSGYYPVDYSLAPIQRATTPGAPPTNLSRTSGSLQMNYR